MIETYDRDGNPIDEQTWAVLHADPEYKRVAFEEFDGGGVSVSTVWLGLNHEWDARRPPLIFETMVFGGKLDGEQWRFSTEEDALKGHALVVQLVLAAYAPGADAE
jgi:hypothetical protein